MIYLIILKLDLTNQFYKVCKLSLINVWLWRRCLFFWQFHTDFISHKKIQIRFLIYYEYMVWSSGQADINV
jgi:hypothetical protein